MFNLGGEPLNSNLELCPIEKERGILYTADAITIHKEKCLEEQISKHEWSTVVITGKWDHR